MYWRFASKFRRISSKFFSSKLSDMSRFIRVIGIVQRLSLSVIFVGNRSNARAHPPRRRLSARVESLTHCLLEKSSFSGCGRASTVKRIIGDIGPTWQVNRRLRWAATRRKWGAKPVFFLLWILSFRSPSSPSFIVSPSLKKKPTFLETPYSAVFEKSSLENDFFIKYID